MATVHVTFTSSAMAVKPYTISTALKVPHPCEKTTDSRIKNSIASRKVSMRTFQISVNIGRKSMATFKAYQEANARGTQLQEGPTAVSVRYNKRSRKIIVQLSTGIEIGFSPHLAQGLESAEPVQLEEIEITPSRLGLHFPRLDADLYIPALLQGFFGSKNWAAAQLGAKGGGSSSATSDSFKLQQGHSRRRPPL
jgi:hypothetical protein